MIRSTHRAICDALYIDLNTADYTPPAANHYTSVDGILGPNQSFFFPNTLEKIKLY
jgi:hypothetical protein